MSLRQLTDKEARTGEKQDEVEDGWMERGMEMEQWEEEERIRNGRTDDVEGKGRGRWEASRNEKGGKGGEKKWVSFFFFFLWSVPWVWQYQVNLGG